jgi:TPR repeat protein
VRAAIGAAFLMMLALPAAGQPASDQGAEDRLAAFARHDSAAAADVWLELAAAGSVEAAFGLGLLNDLGLGMPRDAARALTWYRLAAEAGFSAAQFNVAVMLDAGTGGPRDLAAAAGWYARAAANGHRRAQYNLGLLYAAGEGVPRNPDLARYWLGRAALPAAARRLATLAPAEGSERAVTPPLGLTGAVVAGDGWRRAELAWSAAPAPAGARFLVEIATLPANAAGPAAIVVSAATEASAYVAELPEPSAAYAWRVSLVDGSEGRYAASPWRRLDGAADGGPLPASAGLVILRILAWDEKARWLADELAESLSGAGLGVRVESTGDAMAGSGVRYAWRDDAGLAGAIAAFLPVLAAEDAVLSPAAGGSPGEVVVELVGGPSQPALPRAFTVASHVGCGTPC